MTSLEVISRTGMTSVDPSPDEVLTFLTVKEVLTWAAVPGEIAEEKTMQGALMLSLGATAAMPPRVIGAMSETDFQDILPKVQVDGQPPTPVQRTTAELFGRACRVASGTQLREAEFKAASDKAAAEAHALALAEAAKPPTSTAIVPTSKGRLVKLSTVINQTSEMEVSILEPGRLKQAYKRYYDVFKKEPPPDKELTAEQLSGLDALLNDPALPVPYLDFSIWGPHHHRMEKRIKLAGSTFDTSGRLRQIEIFGPPSFEAWSESYGCAETGFTMFNTVDLGNVLNYSSKTKSMPSAMDQLSGI